MSEAGVALEATGAREPRPSLEALTGARFLAAFWVLAYHFAIKFRFEALPGKPSPGALPGWLAPALLQGHLAVDFFFLLSGFILSYTYVASDGGLRGGRRAFWVARVARIYPVYLLGLALGLWPFLLAEPSRAVDALSLVTHLTMLHGWVPVALDWDQPSWSLGVEATFYAAFPLVLPLAGRLRQRGLWLLLGCSWLVFGAVVLALQGLSVAGFATLPGFRDIARYSAWVNFPEFIAGMAVGLLFTRYGAQAFAWLDRLRGWAFDALTLAALVALGVALVALYQSNLVNIPVDVGAPIVLPALAALMLLLAWRRGVIARLLSTPPLVWLGEISYAVYILHDPLWYWLSAPLWALVSGVSLALMGRPASDLAFFLAFTAVTVAAAGLSFQYLERPLRRAIRQRWGQPEPARTTARRSSDPAPQATAEPDGTRMKTS